MQFRAKKQEYGWGQGVKRKFWGAWALFGVVVGIVFFPMIFVEAFWNSLKSWAKCERDLWTYGLKMLRAPTPKQNEGAE